MLLFLAQSCPESPICAVSLQAVVTLREACLRPGLLSLACVPARCGGRRAQERPPCGKPSFVLRPPRWAVLKPRDPPAPGLGAGASCGETSLWHVQCRGDRGRRGRRGRRVTGWAAQNATPRPPERHWDRREGWRQPPDLHVPLPSEAALCETARSPSSRPPSLSGATAREPPAPSPCSCSSEVAAVGDRRGSAALAPGGGPGSPTARSRCVHGPLPKTSDSFTRAVPTAPGLGWLRTAALNASF